MKMISIIIPVYNLEDYITNCLDSIYSQGVDEGLFEVIAVDDGSKDHSLDKLKNYADKHSNLRVYSQVNMGVSVARNNALNHCSSKFVTFIDADDQMGEGALQHLCEMICNNGDSFDVCYLRTFVKKKDGAFVETHLWQKLFKEGVVYRGHDITKNNYLNGGSVCGGIYQLLFLQSNKMFFGEGITNAEDTIFNYMLFAKNPRIVFSNHTLNLVTVRPESASHSNTMERVLKFQTAIEYLINYHNTYELTLPEKQALDASVYHIISLAVNMYIQVGGRSYNEIMNLLEIKRIWKLNIPWMGKNQKLKVRILNNSFYVYYRLLRIKNFGI